MRIKKNLRFKRPVEGFRRPYQSSDKPCFPAMIFGSFESLNWETLREAVSNGPCQPRGTSWKLPYIEGCGESSLEIALNRS